MFFVFDIFAFLAGKWRHELPKFGFANMGYLMLPFERTFHKDLKTEKSFEICLFNQKIWRFKMWVFAFFSNKMVENSNF